MNIADLLFKKFVDEYRSVNGDPDLKEILQMEQAFMNGILAVTAALDSEVAVEHKIVAMATIKKDAERVAEKRMTQATQGGNPSGN